jgi:hypothetical protein
MAIIFSYIAVRTAITEIRNGDSMKENFIVPASMLWAAIFTIRWE